MMICCHDRGAQLIGRQMATFKFRFVRSFKFDNKLIWQPALNSCIQSASNEFEWAANCRHSFVLSIKRNFVERSIAIHSNCDSRLVRESQSKSNGRTDTTKRRNKQNETKRNEMNWCDTKAHIHSERAKAKSNSCISSLRPKFIAPTIHKHQTRLVSVFGCKSLSSSSYVMVRLSCFVVVEVLQFVVV